MKIKDKTISPLINLINRSTSITNKEHMRYVPPPTPPQPEARPIQPSTSPFGPLKRKQKANRPKKGATKPTPSTGIKKKKSHGTIMRNGKKTVPIKKKRRSQPDGAKRKRYPGGRTFFPKQNNHFVTKAPEFNAASVKKRLSYVSNFFFGIGNVLVNHFFFFCQLFDHSLFSSISGVAWDAIVKTFSLYDTVWTTLIGVISSTTNLPQGRAKYGKYLPILRVFAYMLSTYTHSTGWIYILRNLPFINQVFRLPGLTKERWSYQVVNRVIYYVINKKLRALLFRRVQSKYDQSINGIGQSLIRFGIYFTSLGTCSFFEDADPVASPEFGAPPPYNNTNKKRTRDASWANATYYDTLTNLWPSTTKEAKTEPPGVIQELNDFLEKLEIKADPSGSTQNTATLPALSLNWTSRSFKSSQAVFSMLKNRLHEIGPNLLTTFENALIPYLESVDPDRQSYIFLYVLSTCVSLVEKFNIDLKHYPAFNSAIKNYQKTLGLTKGFKLVDGGVKEGLSFQDRGFVKDDLAVEGMGGDEL
jgi:hypothetical protein